VKKTRTFENEVCEVKQTVLSAETSGQYMCEVLEEVKTNINLIRNNINKLDRKVIESVTELQKNLSELLNSVIGLKSKSIRDNLVFTGIPESMEGFWKEVLRDFTKSKLKIYNEIPLERIHQMDKTDAFLSRPSNIVAKFRFFKDHEYVRRSAPVKLKGTNIWVNEQFPPEV
jgi:hypothetical protein